MKNIIQKLILSGIGIVALFGLTSNVLAANPPLSVTFTPDPLFVQGNFLPADEATGTVKVENLGTSSQTVITEAVQVLDPDDLSSQLHLLITKISGGGAIYDGSFKTFLTGGEKVLSVLSPSSDETYTFIVTFNNIDDNSYQGKTLNFNVCVGFQGGNTHCGNTVVGDENGTDDDGGTGNPPSGGTIPGSGGDGGGAVPIILTIFNEQASNISSEGGLPGTGTATITWDTNILATSQVIYGPVPGPYSLNLATLPNFGYPSGTSEDPIKVIHHSMPLSGLTPGQTYLYRVVSRASPPTVSFEHQFTVPLLAFNPNNVTNPNNPNGATGGANGNGTGSISNTSSDGNAEDLLSTEESEDGGNGLTASAIFSGFGDIWSTCSLIGLLILLLIYLVWRLWLRKRYEKLRMSEEEILIKFFLFFGEATLLAIIVALLLKRYCILPILLIAFVVSICVFVYRKFLKK